MKIAVPPGSGRNAPAWLPAGVFLAATTCAAAAAWLLGTMAGAGMIIVAASFGLCFAAGGFLYQLAVSAP